MTTDRVETRGRHENLALDPSRQAFLLLRTAFTVAPILFGLDKFFNLMTEWTQYLALLAADLTPGTPQQFMYVVGVIEILAGIVVAVRPGWGGYLVAAWLAGIIANLLLLGSYLDVALRDVGLMLGALALARLASRPRARPAAPRAPRPV